MISCAIFLVQVDCTQNAALFCLSLYKNSYELESKFSGKTLVYISSTSFLSVYQGIRGCYHALRILTDTNEGNLLARWRQAIVA